MTKQLYRLSYHVFLNDTWFLSPTNARNPTPRSFMWLLDGEARHLQAMLTRADACGAAEVASLRDVHVATYKYLLLFYWLLRLKMRD
jgi:hypothetical protein